MQSRGPASRHGDDTGGGISPDEFENAIVELLPLSAQDGTPAQKRPFKDSLFLRVTRLLELLGKHTWSMRPRTYIVLRMINRVDAMSGFVAEGLFDISLPYSQRTLPGVITSQSARSKFLELQRLVLSEQASTIEGGEGRHRHFIDDGDVHFKPIKRLGEGGFGEVDHVWSRLSYNEFARKRILRGRTFGKDKELVSGFERELDILKRLSHCHLVEYVGSYTDPRYVGLIMSPVADSDLAKYLGLDPFPAEKLILLRRFYGCLVSALDYLHENKIRHKDIKPSNILVSGETIFITDFGTSLDWTDRGHSTTSGMRGAISRPYCSPEAFNSDPRNSSSDVYSLGCVFLEMTTVLRRQSLECMKKHFHSHGTNESYVRTNPDAVYSWLEKLRGEPSPDYDDQPFEWIKDMVRVNPESRPSAPELVSRISASAGSFIGTCCTGDHGSADSSYQGSVLDQEVTLVDQDPGGSHESEIENRVGTPAQLAVSEKLQDLRVSTPSDIKVSPFTREQETTQLLLEHGYDINSVHFDYNAVLLQGSMMGYQALVRLMLERGADTEVADKSGTKALQAAASNGHIEVVKVLLAAKADVNAHTPQGTALQAAAKGSHVEVVKVLLASKADVNAVGPLETAALQSAAARGHAKLVELLLAAGADVDRKYYDHSQAPLTGAAAGGHVEVLKMLIAAGARTDSRTGATGQTALQAAASGGHIDAMHILLAAGADVNAAPGPTYGSTALQAATRAGHIEAMELLLAAKADVNAAPAEFRGLTALQAAAGGGHTKAVEILLDAKAEVNAAACRQYGRTALQAAAEGGYIAIVCMLLANGADVSAPMADAGGITALQAAEGKGNQLIIQLLHSTLQPKRHTPPPSNPPSGPLVSPPKSSRKPAGHTKSSTPSSSVYSSGPVAPSPPSASSDAPPPLSALSKWLDTPYVLSLRDGRPTKRDKPRLPASSTGLVEPLTPPVSSDAPPPLSALSKWLDTPYALSLRDGRPTKRDKPRLSASSTGLVEPLTPLVSSDALLPLPASDNGVYLPSHDKEFIENYKRPSPYLDEPDIQPPPPVSSDAPPPLPAPNGLIAAILSRPRGRESMKNYKRSSPYLDELGVQTPPPGSSNKPVAPPPSTPHLSSSQVPIENYKPCSSASPDESTVPPPGSTVPPHLRTATPPYESSSGPAAQPLPPGLRFAVPPPYRSLGGPATQSLPPGLRSTAPPLPRSSSGPATQPLPLSLRSTAPPLPKSSSGPVPLPLPPDFSSTVPAPYKSSSGLVPLSLPPDFSSTVPAPYKSSSGPVPPPNFSSTVPAPYKSSSGLVPLPLPPDFSSTVPAPYKSSSGPVPPPPPPNFSSTVPAPYKSSSGPAPLPLPPDPGSTVPTPYKSSSGPPTQPLPPDLRSIAPPQGSAAYYALPPRLRPAIPSFPPTTGPYQPYIPQPSEVKPRKRSKRWGIL